MRSNPRDPSISDSRDQIWFRLSQLETKLETSQKSVNFLQKVAFGAVGVTAYALFDPLERHITIDARNGPGGGGGGSPGPPGPVGPQGPQGRVDPAEIMQAIDQGIDRQVGKFREGEVKHLNQTVGIELKAEKQKDEIARLRLEDELVKKQKAEEKSLAAQLEAERVKQLQARRAAEELEQHKSTELAKRQQAQMEHEKAMQDEAVKKAAAELKAAAALTKTKQEGLAAETKLALEKERAVSEEREKRALETERKVLALRAADEQERKGLDHARALELVAAQGHAQAQAQAAAAAAAGDASAKAEVANQAVRRRALQAQGDLDRRKAVEVVQATLGLVGGAAEKLVTSPSHAASAVALTLGVAGAVYGSREGAKLARERVLAVLGRPALVRETSRGADAAKQQLLGGRAVFPPSLEERLRVLATATRTAKKHNAPFRHVMFYGPPGTGKTLVAKQLARYSGLDYAIMSGGDVAPLRESAVTDIHALFRWAEASGRGLLLFVDEAEAFLLTRNDPSMGEHARAALNALLYNSGAASSSFMLVVATNRPRDLDSAVLDRVDEHVMFALPGLEERRKLVKLYFDKYVVKPPGVSFDAEEMSESVLDGLADDLEGFSGRGISKLMIAAQGTAYGKETGFLTLEDLKHVVALKKEQHERLRLAEDNNGAGADFY